DSEHLLLGLLRDPQGRASTLLASRGVSMLELRAEVERSLPSPAPANVHVDIPLTAEARRVLEIAVEEAARGRGGSEHVLLGLVRETSGLAGRILRGHGFDADALRDALNGWLELPRGERMALDATTAIREATPADLETILRHRRLMYVDMGHRDAAA